MPSLRGRSTVGIWLAFAGGAALAVAAGLFLLSLRLDPIVRGRVVQALAARFDADVRLASLHVSLFPSPRVTAEGLALRHKGWDPSQKPFIGVRKFTAYTGYGLLFGPVKRVTNIRLEGLVIDLPPNDRGKMKQGMVGHPKRGENRFPFVIEEIVADGTVLVIEPRSKDKESLDFDIGKLTLHSVGAGQPMSFRASLTNPKPPGNIESTGSFGPWMTEDPRQTPVSGKYTFRHADLSVFAGIAGILSSDGEYGGVLERIAVRGDTDTPDFTVATAGFPVDLKTHYSAIVDGTNGDTTLDPVDAQFLHSSLECRGAVTDTPGIKGKAVSLDVKTIHARIEDLLRLTVKARRPALTGAIAFQTKFFLPPGGKDVMTRLALDGQFGITAAKFTDTGVQGRMNDLSLRAQGRPKEIGEDMETFASDFHGRFRLKDGVASFSRLSFGIPGAQVNLDGDYGLKSGELDFHGTLRMQAKISQTVTGFKSILLKVADPFFKKNGAGSVVPIRITGTQDHPSFGIEFNRKASAK